MIGQGFPALIMLLARLLELRNAYVIPPVCVRMSVCVHVHVIKMFSFALRLVSQ